MWQSCLKAQNRNWVNFVLREQELYATGVEGCSRENGAGKRGELRLEGRKEWELEREEKGVFKRLASG